jgi:hypothetical protein
MTPSNSPSKKRISLYYLCNCLFLVFMVVAAFMIRSGQADYLPHASVDKQFVQDVIATGETENAWNALKTTEIARAEGFRGMVTMMDLMQSATIVMALFFVLNGYFLFKLRSGPSAPASVPVMVRS